MGGLVFMRFRAQVPEALTAIEVMITIIIKRQTGFAGLTCNELLLLRYNA